MIIITDSDAIGKEPETVAASSGQTAVKLIYLDSKRKRFRENYLQQWTSFELVRSLPSN